MVGEVAKANIDPLPILDLTDCVQELRRRGIPLPERGPWDTDEIYRGMCQKVWFFICFSLNLQNFRSWLYAQLCSTSNGPFNINIHLTQVDNWSINSNQSNITIIYQYYILAYGHLIGSFIRHFFLSINYLFLSLYSYMISCMCAFYMYINKLFISDCERTDPIELGFHLKWIFRFIHWRMHLHWNIVNNNIMK